MKRYAVIQFDPGLGNMVIADYDLFSDATDAAVKLNDNLDFPLIEEVYIVDTLLYRRITLDEASRICFNTDRHSEC